VATIVNNNIHIVGYGTSTITATQSGNSVYYAATSVNQTLTITGISQTISFAALPAKTFGDADFAPGATATSGLAISYSSSNTSVATIVNNNIHIVGTGTAVIMASQSGNTTYYAANSVNQTLTVTKTYTYVPTSTTILSGTLNSGTFGDLATNNSSYYVVNSTTTGTRKLDWYGSAFITQSPSTVTKLTVTYDGKNSASKTQVLYLYNFFTAAWVQIDSRAVSTTDVTITNTQNSPANYISSTGEIRLRVYSSSGTANYTCSGDWMQFQIQSTSAAKGGIEITTNQTAATLLELFPNPSNQFANLHYLLKEDSKVSLSLFDVNGKKIKTILNNELQLSGDRLIQIDNNGLPKGIYFLQAIINNKISNMKMVIN
ncbi:MAG: T9SS type A sorting domain-containing protein, partial [Bacteroidota bacterium]